MSAEKDQPFFLVRNSGLRDAVPADDFLHPKVNADVKSDSLTETQYFGICDPKTGIHGLTYVWHHPNLKILTGGVWVWRGMRPFGPDCDIHDWWTYMSDRAIANDLHEVRLDNSYSVKVIEPLKRFALSYDDPVRKNSIRLDYTALRPPVMFGDGKHFEQPLKVQGEIVLRGQSFKIDSYNIRDRSWGKPRPETNNPIPPMVWMTCVLDEQNYFNCTAFDHLDLDPEWKSIFPNFTGDKAFIAGWIVRNGELTELVACRKRTTRDPVTLFPKTIEMTMTDAKGRNYAVKGQIVAGSFQSTWANVRTSVNMTRWEFDGRVGWGDSQEMLTHDFIYAMTRRG